MKLFRINSSTGEIEDRELLEDDAIIVLFSKGENEPLIIREVAVLPAENTCFIPAIKKTLTWDGWEYKIENFPEEDKEGK